jgi:hypothetical protein
MVTTSEGQIPEGLPCKNCLLVLYRKYSQCDLKLLESAEIEETLLVLERGIIIKEEPVTKMTPGCRFCKVYYNHVINSLAFFAEVIWQ